MRKHNDAYKLAPICDCCGKKMSPEFFIEEESVLTYGFWMKTGRKRWNINYFICPSCLNKACCDDDSFAGEWSESLISNVEQ